MLRGWTFMGSTVARLFRRRFLALPPLLLYASLAWTSSGDGADKKDSSAPSAGLTLAACRQLALEEQPALKAYRASQAAAAAKARAVDDLRLAPLVAHDIPIRRKQSALGVQIAEARVVQAEQETIYAVTRNYLTVLYARQQEALVDRALENLRDLKDTVKQIVDDGLRKDVTARDLDRINVLVLLAEGKQEEAKAGSLRALAALREAIGLETDVPLALADNNVPYPQPEVKHDQVLELALSKRQELLQASLAAEVVCLEVKAQGKMHGPQGRTFAAAADLHADAVPQGSQNSEYRPGAVGVEMPTMLVGDKSARVEEAEALQARADAVVEKTRKLITLDAEDTFLRWQEWSRKASRFREAAEQAEKLSRNLRDDFKMAGTKVRLDDVITSGILATQIRVEGNEAQFKFLLVLAALERVTGGGLQFDFGFGKKPTP
jgi:outer membrane protein TolC